MAGKVRGVAFLSLVGAAFSEVSCPPAGFESIANFDLYAYISKRWYVQQQMPVVYLPESQNRCVFADYTLRTEPGLFGYEVSVFNYAEEVAPPFEVRDSGDTLCAKVVDSDRGQLAVAPCVAPTQAAGPYWVLDYNEEEGYALVSGGPPTVSAPGGCRTGTDTTNNAGLWIFTRKQQRDQVLVDKVRGIASGKGFDLSVLNDVDQSSCDKNPPRPLVCPPQNFETVKNFDLDAFIAKRWYVQQQMEVSYLPVSQNRCVRADYTKRDHTCVFGYDLQVHNYAEEVAAPHTVHDSGNFLCAKVANADRGQLEVSPCLLPSFLGGPYWVLDYSEAEGYALISGGAPTKKGDGGCKTGCGTNDSGLWIFTRNRMRNEELVKKVRGIAALKGFDVSVLNDVDQTECNDDDDDESTTPTPTEAPTEARRAKEFLS